MRRLLPASRRSWLLPSGTRSGGLSERMRIPPEMASSLGCLASQSQPHSRQGSRSNPSCVHTLSATRDPDARRHTRGPAAPLSRAAGAPTVPGRAHSRATGRPHRYAAAKELSAQSEGPKRAVMTCTRGCVRICRRARAPAAPLLPAAIPGGRGCASWAVERDVCLLGGATRSDSTRRDAGKEHPARPGLLRCQALVLRPPGSMHCSYNARQWRERYRHLCRSGIVTWTGSGAAICRLIRQGKDSGK